MNSTQEIWSIKEVALKLRKINHCKIMKKQEYADGSSEEYICCMESMCDTCQDDMAALLEWSEDLEDEVKQPVWPPS